MSDEWFTERFEDAPPELRELVQNIADRYYGGRVHALWRTIVPSQSVEPQRETPAPAARPDGPLPKPW